MAPRRDFQESLASKVADWWVEREDSVYEWMGGPHARMLAVAALAALIAMSLTALIAMSLTAKSQSCPAASSFPAPGACVYADGGSTCAPGEFDPSLTIAQLCSEGQSRRCKPSASLKRKIAAAYGQTRCGEVDHVIPLVLAGLNTAKNLQCQPAPEFKHKDVVEDAAYRGVCSGKLSLEAARAMVRDWQANYERLKDHGR